MNDTRKVYCALHVATKWRIDVENHAVCENYSCEVRGFLVAANDQVKIARYVETSESSRG